MPNIQAVILAGGPATRLGILSEHRTEAAVPYGGKYRLIDFTLSNCVNSGIYNVAVLTQYRPHSLNEHIGIGRPWDLDRQRGGVQMLQPYLSRDTKDWHRGTADSVYQNLRFFDSSADTFVILAGDHVYKMDYRPMLRAHAERRADVTLAVATVSEKESHRYGMVNVDRQDRVTAFWEKPTDARGSLASMGVYVFSREALEKALSGQNGERPDDFGRDVFPKLISQSNVYAHPFLGYFVDVGTIEAYWNAQMMLLEDKPPLDLYDPGWVIHTRSEERPPAKTNPGATVERSLVSNGCRISGTVERSVLSPGVVVEEGAIVRDAIIMTDTHIGAGAVVDHAILDKLVRVGEGAVIGGDGAAGPEELTLVGKAATVPARARIGRKCVIHPGTTEGEFPSSVGTGTTVGKPGAVLPEFAMQGAGR